LVDAKFRVQKAELSSKRIPQVIPESVGNPTNVCLEIRVNAVQQL